MKELKLKYKGSILGITWSLFNPLMMIIIYTIAFKFILKIDIESYSVFVFTGLLPWLFIQTTISQSSGSIINHGNLIKKVYFPRAILPLSITFSNFINFLITLVILFISLFFFKIKLTIYLLALPILFLFILLFVSGLSLLLSSLTTRYRDVAYLMEVVFQAWFYLTPIIYPLDMVPDFLQRYILCNPITSMVEVMRALVFYGKMPSLLHIYILVFSSIFMFVVGFIVFRSREYNFVDEV